MSRLGLFLLCLWGAAAASSLSLKYDDYVSREVTKQLGNLNNWIEGPEEVALIKEPLDECSSFKTVVDAIPWVNTMLDQVEAKMEASESILLTRRLLILGELATLGHKIALAQVDVLSSRSHKRLFDYNSNSSIKQSRDYGANGSSYGSIKQSRDYGAYGSGYSVNSSSSQGSYRYNPPVIYDDYRLEDSRPHGMSSNAILTTSVPLNVPDQVHSSYRSRAPPIVPATALPELTAAEVEAKAQTIMSEVQAALVALLTQYAAKRVEVDALLAKSLAEQPDLDPCVRLEQVRYFHEVDRFFAKFKLEAFKLNRLQYEPKLSANTKAMIRAMINQTEVMKNHWRVQILMDQQLAIPLSVHEMAKGEY